MSKQNIDNTINNKSENLDKEISDTLIEICVVARRIADRIENIGKSKDFNSRRR